MKAASRQPRVVAGFRTFFVSVVVAGILGTAVRLYFSPARIESFLRAEIERAHLPFKVEFKSAHLTLSRGLLAAFAFDVVDVRLSHFAPCVTEPFIESGVLILPVDWLSLLRGQVRLGWVVADTVRVSADRVQCLPPTVSPSSPKDDELEDKEVSSGTTREPQQVKPWFRAEDLTQIKNAIAGFEILNGTVYFDQSKKSVLLTYADFWHKGDEVALEGSVTLPPEITYGETFPPINFRGDITPEVAKLEARSSFDEGELGASIELKPTDDPNSPFAKVLFRAGAMPLSIFSDFLKKLGVLSNARLHPRFLWLSCDLSSEGPLKTLVKNSALKIDNCMVEGDAGQILIGPALRDQDGIWQPFKIEIKHFVVQDLLDTFQEKGPSGVMSSFGVIKGTIDYLEKDQQSLNVTLEDSEVFFSNRHERATQKISSVGVTAVRSEGKVKGKIANIVLNPGEVIGDIAFAFDDKFKSGTLDINTRELALDPRIEKLMADGLFEHLQVKGAAKIDLGKFTDWKGQIQASLYTGAQLKFLKPIVDTKFDGKRFDIIAQASTGELSPQSRWLSWLKRADEDVKMGSASGQDWIPISNIKNQISVEPQLVSWKNATLASSQSKTQLISTGEIRNEVEAAGLLTVVEQGRKPRKFVISGSAYNPNLKPQD